MPDIAALQLTADSKNIRDVTVALREMPAAASAAERAAERWGVATTAAGRSSEDFSRRVQGTIRSLEFERAQLSRSAAEQAKYTALRRAGVSAASAEGQAIAASVAALQAQRAAVKGAGEAHTIAGKATQAAGTAASALVSHLKLLALAYISVEGARKLWEIGLKAGDLGEQAEQVGVNTDQLQAYRLAAAQAGIESEQMDVALTKLAKSMGAAKDGGKEMIARFEELGVKLLDARGELRPVADVLPEVARGILAVGSSSQRTAILQDLFGKSGAKMATVLGDIAKGNDALIQSAREQNAIISPDAIAAWDTLGDRMKVTQQKFSTLVAEFGARFALPGIEILNGMLESTKKELEGILSVLNAISSRMDAAKRAAPVIAAQVDANNIQERLDTLRQNPSQFGFKASEKALMDQLAARQAAVAAQQSIVQFAQQGALQASGAPSTSASAFLPQTPLGVNEGGTKGVSNPAAKATGGSDPYTKAIESAKEYTALKNAETAAIGQNVEAAARLKHEQELINKGSVDANKLTPPQIANLKALAAEMAAADSKFATATFMDEASKKSAEFIAQQEIERDTLWMSAEAADAYRIAQTALNDAKAKGIELSAADVAKLRERANAQAAASEKTRQAKELYDLAKDSFSGFISDIRQGLMDGKSVWETFGTAATNALDKIASKLLDMATQKLFEAAFGGAAGGGGGGLFGGLFSWIGGLTGTGVGPGVGVGADALMGLVPVAKGGVFDRGRELAFANGAAFQAGNVVRFAGGGVVTSPTQFAMAGGQRGLMGEAGAEGILPLHRGRDGGLGVRASGLSQGGGSNGTVDIYIHDGTEMLLTTIDNRSNANIVRASPAIEGRAVKKANTAVPSMVAQDHATRGGDYRTK